VSVAEAVSDQSSVICVSARRDSDDSSTVATSSWTSDSSGTLVPSSLSTADTPRKRELKHKLRIKIRQCRRLQSKLSAVSKHHTTVMSKQSALNKLKPCLSNAAFSLISAQVRLHNKTVRHWTDNERLIAMSVYYQSPRAYRYLSKILKLPSKASINRWLKTVRVEPGINWYMIKLLEAKMKHFSDVDRQCVLLMDEMSLKKGLRYCKMRDLVVGYVDDGTERKPTMATSALVFMIRGIFKCWKQAVCFAFTCDSLQSFEVKQLTEQIFTALQDIGLKILGLVSDQGSTFSKMFREWGVSSSQPFVNISGNRVLVFPDPPHLLKNMRNMLFHNDVVHSGGTAKWCYITQLFEKDSSKVYRLAPRLKNKHISLPPFSQMKVKLASQALSHSVAAGIETYISHNQLPVDAMATAEFCGRVNDLFDCFNSSTLKCRSAPNRSALSTGSCHLKLLNDISTWLDGIKVIDRVTGKQLTNRFKCIIGWKQAIEALKLLWSTVSEMDSVKFLFTRRINQDPLENFFGVIRQRGCLRDNPVPLEFLFSFKQACVNGLLAPSQFTNSEVDVDDLLMIFAREGMSNSTKQIQAKSCSKSKQFAVTPTHDLECGSDILEVNGLVYFAGFMLKKLLSVHKCEHCSSLRDMSLSVSLFLILCIL